MKIDFRRINRLPIPFNANSGDIEFQGNLKYDNDGLVHLSAVMFGELDLICDLCGSEFSYTVKEEIDFLISDGVYTSQNNNLDVVELNGGMVDTEDILSSEIELIKSDYHKCGNCQHNERN